MKKIIINLLLIIGIFPIIVNASTNSLVKVGNNYYDTLEEAIKNASSTDTITLVNDVKLDTSIDINKTVNINLNGNDIIGKEKVFVVKGGTLNISGKGTIKESSPNYGAIMVVGSTDKDDNLYSVVNIFPDVTLEGWSGIFISQDNSKSYGVLVNFYGKIKAVSDTSGGSGIGIYVNGNIQDKTNAPIVNILDGSIINSNGEGLYIAGYSTFNIGASTITGVQAGIGIKSGKLNINGATITCTGADNTPTEGYNNGMKASGTAIQIESNNGYAGDIGLNIKNGNITSKNSNVIYEYIGKGDTTQVESINISGGTFISEAKKDVFRVSDSLKNKFNNFITGGKYSSNPSTYLKNGYTATSENNLYNVVKSTMKEVDKTNENNSNGSNNPIIWLIITIIVIGTMILIYFNKSKVFNIFKN